MKVKGEITEKNNSDVWSDEKIHMHFVLLGNIVFIPKILDPFTGHESKRRNNGKK